MAGTIVTTATDIGGGITKYSVAWTSDASAGTVNATFDMKRGALIQTVFVPGSGGSQPSSGYAASLLDANGIDVLLGAGASLSNAAGSYNLPSTPPLVEAQTVTLSISAAGNAKTGTINFFVLI